MYSDLIIGYNGRPAASDALALGRRLAETTGAKPTVVYVHPHLALTSGMRDAAFDVGWRNAAQRVLDGARLLMRDMPDATFHATRAAAPGAVLRGLAAEADAALVVLGSTHRTRVGRSLLGTTAGDLLHDAPCPVAVAPAGYAGREPAHAGVVGVAVDDGVDTEVVARVAAAIARRAGARLRLLTVIETHHLEGPIHPGYVGYAALRDAVHAGGGKALERARIAAGPGVEIERWPREGSVAAELCAASLDLDLLVLGSRGYGPWRRMLERSVSGRVIARAGCPVIVVPRGADAHADVLAPLAAGTVGAAPA